MSKTEQSTPKTQAQAKRTSTKRVKASPEVAQASEGAKGVKTSERAKASKAVKSQATTKADKATISKRARSTPTPTTSKNPKASLLLVDLEMPRSHQEQSRPSPSPREHIVELLREIGVYSPSFDFLIESCAQLVDARNKAYEVMCQSEPIIKELSREGEARLKAHPIYGVYIEINKELRQVLGELTMTVRTSNTSEGDALDTLNSKLREALQI